MARNLQSRTLTTRPSSSGFTLVELAVAGVILVVLTLAVGTTLVQGIKQRRESLGSFQSLIGVRDVLAEIQETANLPQDLTVQKGIGAIYQKYHGTTIPVPDLPSGEVTITCFPNEAQVPAILGGPQDLNFDGDAADNLGIQSNGSDLKLIPMFLDVTFDGGGFQQLFTVHRLVTRTADEDEFAGLGGGADPMAVSPSD